MGYSEPQRHNNVFQHTICMCNMLSCIHNIHVQHACTIQPKDQLAHKGISLHYALLEKTLKLVKSQVRLEQMQGTNGRATPKDLGVCYICMISRLYMAVPKGYFLFKISLGPH